MDAQEQWDSADLADRLRKIAEAWENLRDVERMKGEGTYTRRERRSRLMRARWQLAEAIRVGVVLADRVARR